MLAALDRRSDVLGHVSGAARRQLAAQAEQRRVKAWTGSGIGSPASAGTPRESLAARYLGGIDSRGRRPPLDRLLEADHELDQPPLELDRRRQAPGGP